MDLQAGKLKLVQAVLNIEEINLEKDIENLLKSSSTDWFDDLNAGQQASVITGLKQSDKGETISQEKVFI